MGVYNRRHIIAEKYTEIATGELNARIGVEYAKIWNEAFEADINIEIERNRKADGRWSRQYRACLAGGWNRSRRIMSWSD